MHTSIPIIFDNSMLSMAKQCQKKAYWRYERWLTIKEESNIDLIAGAAFAVGLNTMRESWLDGKSAYIALDSGLNALEQAYGTPIISTKHSNKNIDNMLGALAGYAEHWPLDASNRKIIATECELKASIEPYTYAGKVDALVLDSENALWILDDKTTGYLDSKWISQWNLSSQMLGYYWAAQQLYPKDSVRGVLIRGVGLTKNVPQFVEIEIRPMQWEIDRWVKNTLHTIEHWQETSKTKQQQMALDWQCSRCNYNKLCSSREPELLIADNYIENLSVAYTK